MMNFVVIIFVKLLFICMDIKIKKVTHLRSLKEKEKEEILNKIAKTLELFSDVEIAYIFGSFLEGHFEDIDVGVVVKENLPREKMIRIKMELGRIIEKNIGHIADVDVKILNRTPIYFQYEVIKNGKLIFFRDKEKPMVYEAEVLSKYLDYKYTLDKFKKMFLRV